MWQALINQLRELRPGRTYTLRSLIVALRSYTPIDETLENVPEILRGPLAWLGIIGGRQSCFMITAAGHAALTGDDDCAFAPTGFATIRAQSDAYWLDLPPTLPTRAWAEFVAWGTLDQDRWCVDAVAVAQAVEQGYTAHTIAQTLGNLTGMLISRKVFDQIDGWVKQAQRFVLRQVTVLTSPDTDLLASLRQDRRLRTFFGEPLAPQHSAIPVHAARPLMQHLNRRGYTVTSLITPPPESDHSAGITPDMAAYLWLALRVYRRLQELAQLPVNIPGDLEHWLRDFLPSGQTDEWQIVVDRIRDDLARAIDGYAARSTLTLEYFSPGYGATTIRTIAPMVPITTSGGAEYVEAWCHTADAARTFRLDRIIRVLSA